MRRRLLAHGALVAAVALLVGGAAAPGARAATRPVRLVAAVDGVQPTVAGLRRAAPDADVRAVRPLGDGLVAVTVRASGPSAAAAALDASPRVEGATLERRFTLGGAKAPAFGDARADRQWDLWDTASDERAGGYGMDAPRAWSVTTGDPRVVVAVLDTGITDHPDLAGASTVPGYDFVSGTDGVDPVDGDGWDPDPTDEGDACASTGEAASWHGTFVAGELVARHDGRYVAGAAPGIALLPVRVLGACGGAESDTIAAITWASGGAVPGVPAVSRRADVISMSLGSSDGACSAPLQAAVDAALARGTTIVAAAGNDGADVAEASPASCAGVVSVAASTRRGALAAYSNRGTGRLAPTIAAPGGSVVVPIAGDGWTTAQGPADTGRPVVVRAAGTSMAAPRVAAAAALLLSTRPGLTPARVAARLVATATRFPASSGCRAAVCGPGVVNAGNAVGAPKRFVRSGAVRITGAARPAVALRADAGRWRPAPGTTRYRWLRDGEPISGATAPTYAIRSRDVGHRISVRVTVRRPGVAAASATSGSLLARPA